MNNVEHVLRTKGSNVFSISPDASVYEAISMMSKKGVGALAVVEGEALVGIISERDYARKVALEGLSSRSAKVRDIMSTSPTTAMPTWSIEYCMETMTERHIRHLPVLAEGKLVGMVSIGDVVKSAIEERNFIIEQLREYLNVS